MTNIHQLTTNAALDVMHDNLSSLRKRHMPVGPVLFDDEHPAVIRAVPTPEEARRGTLLDYAMDLMLRLKEDGCDPSEVFAVLSIGESLVRDHSKIVDVGPEECDIVWNEDRFA